MCYIYQRFEIKSLRDQNKNKYNIPNKLPNFLFDYNHSRFVECNRELAVATLSLNFTQNKTLNNRINSNVNYFQTSLLDLKKRYWLAGGTLLGIGYYYILSFVFNRKLFSTNLY